MLLCLTSTEEKTHTFFLGFFCLIALFRFHFVFAWGFSLVVCSGFLVSFSFLIKKMAQGCTVLIVVKLTIFTHRKLR